MARGRKLEPMEIFDESIKDAKQLLRWGRALLNKRRRSMRSEQRQAFSKMRKINKKDRAKLECAESKDLYIVILPWSRMIPENCQRVCPVTP